MSQGRRGYGKGHRKGHTIPDEVRPIGCHLKTHTVHSNSCTLTNKERANCASGQLQAKKTWDTINYKFTRYAVCIYSRYMYMNNHVVHYTPQERRMK